VFVMPAAMMFVIGVVCVRFVSRKSGSLVDEQGASSHSVDNQGADEGPRNVCQGLVYWSSLVGGYIFCCGCGRHLYALQIASFQIPRS